MRTVVLFLFFLILSGCSLNTLFVPGEINKVTVVKCSSYMKHHRAYFTRTELEMIKEDQKYLYLYHEKEKDLGLLLHRKNQYILYNLSKPKQPELILHAGPKTTYSYVVRSFKRKGFTPITSLDTVGAIVSIAPRRYKGVKTLLVEFQDYSPLQELYRQAIRTYNANRVKNIQTKLPKHFVYDYYRRYENRAKTQTQLDQLQIIAQKLQIKTQEEIYTYYLNEASLDALSAYIVQKDTRASLTYRQYKMLKRRKKSLQEEKLFNEGSLEDLIAAYKINKNPKYKKRIMSLMKDQQENQ
ncbi:hypothetical protein TSL6_15650 [Sulfurovum sp. TSL6]|uniref:hypothetical protein n=1 Tax=Sulfurovum sp. TSL6 TaxID=2826995 RepID=UPI001CC5E699|nr:hypothetical protein [Sulfurovum sp. TSL6]GIU01059.1 hypothetical protein TSL6_15650 [Sulfurovum sp. TSL6]